ncbi:hypothetical protein CBS147311_6448 [Penicillium roqueforti]|nr:hypothetical protein CBS147311_6448 [Penicillium roqueforti]
MFKRLSISAWAIAVLATTAQCQQLSYEDSIAALAYGNVATDTSSAGEVWLNVTGFAVEELPHIQSDVGIHTLDNLETLTAIAGLAQDAAKRGQWGDIVYLHSAFSMNGHVDHLNVSSVEMQESLLEAVTNRTSGKIDSPLVELYANTSSSTFLAEAFKNLKSDANPQRKRWTKEACSTAHRAVTSACRSLLGNINGNATWKSGGPRNICQYGCCISWSANATFQLQNLSSAGNYCVNACASSTVSCDMYATSYQLMAKEALAIFEPAIQARICVPQSVGEFIIQRQIYTLQTLNILIDDILSGSQTRIQKAPPKKKKATDDGATVAMSRLSIKGPQTRLRLSDLVARARDHQDTLEDRPELVPDEKGRRLPVHTDKYISAAVLEAINSSIQGAAIWKYIASILGVLDKCVGDDASRVVLLQEISNICQVELNRAQTLFKRHVQSASGSKWFKRTANVYDSTGSPRVSIKGNLEDLTVSDPQLHHMLRLCQPKLNVSTATTWIKKLGEYQEAHPRERENLEDREADSLGDLAIIIEFIQDLSSVLPIPSFSNKKGQMFAAKSQVVES